MFLVLCVVVVVLTAWFATHAGTWAPDEYSRPNPPGYGVPITMEAAATTISK